MCFLALALRSAHQHLYRIRQVFRSLIPPSPPRHNFRLALPHIFKPAIPQSLLQRSRDLPRFQKRKRGRRSPGSDDPLGLIKQRLPAAAFDHGQSRDPTGLQRASQLAGALAGVWERANGQAGEGDVERCRPRIGGSMPSMTAVSTSVRPRGPGRRLRNQAAVVGDEVGTRVDGGDVQRRVVGDGGVGEQLNRHDGRAVGVVEDPERLVAWWEERFDQGDDVVG